jgi:DNA-binding transcriptional LysR family regulator
MHFDLTDLRLFANVHDAGTITGGASATHMTLASASERIRGMEESFGVPLLVRDRRGVSLTPAGRALLHHARQVLRHVDNLRGEMGEYGRGLQGHVRMLCNTSALSEHLPDVLGRFLAAHPGISIDLEERNSFDIVDALRQGACDIGVASDAVDTEGLQTFQLRDDPLVLVVPRGHALARRSSISLADAAETPFVGLAQDSALQEHLAFQLRKSGKHLYYRVRLRSLESVCRMVGTGAGIAVVPRAVALQCARAAKIRVIPLADAWAQRKLVLCVLKLDVLTAPARQLTRHLLDAAVGRNAEQTTVTPAGR